MLPSSGESERPPSRTRPSLGRVAAFLVVLLILPNVIGTGWLQEVARGSRPLTQAFFFPVEILGVLLPALAFSSGFDRRTVLRWRPARPSWILVAALASLGWGGVLTYLQTFWQHATGLAPPTGLDWLLSAHSARGWTLLILGAALLPALCEETAFRGLVLSGYGRWGGLVGGGVTTLLFAAYHMTPYGLPTYLVLGTLLAWLAWRTGSVLPGIAAHATNNLLALVQVSLLPEAWWSQHAAIVAPVAVILAIGSTWWLHRAMRD